MNFAEGVKGEVRGSPFHTSGRIRSDPPRIPFPYVPARSIRRVPSSETRILKPARGWFVLRADDEHQSTILLRGNRPYTVEKIARLQYECCPVRHYNSIDDQAGRSLNLPLRERAGLTLDSVGAPTASEPWPSQNYSILTMPRGSPVNARITPRVYDGLYKMEGRERWFRNRQPHRWRSCWWLICLIHRGFIHLCSNVAAKGKPRADGREADAGFRYTKATRTQRAEQASYSVDCEQAARAADHGQASYPVDRKWAS